MKNEKTETLLQIIETNVKDGREALAKRLELTFQALCAQERDHDEHEEETGANNLTIH